jgi:MoaA/NifB/PqqE/SkfB family radical SAM enzyme
MVEPNGTQLYGLRRWIALLRMARHAELRGLSLRQKLALRYVFKESKLTALDGKIFSNTFTPYYPSPAYDRFLRGVISAVSGRPRAVITNFAVTARCPCNCWHCSFSKRNPKDELTLEELKKAIAQVQDLGTSVIGLTGGEPLLRDDLEAIIASVGERSMPLLFTTGYELTPKRVKGLKAAGLEVPVISLDHYRPEVHDRGRRRKGMFESAVRAVEMFRAEGFYVAVSFVPDRRLVDDRDDLFRTIDFFRELGVNDMRLTSPILSGRLTSRPEEKLTEENVRTIFEIQRFCTRKKGYPGVFAYDFFESKRFYGCGAGYHYLFIDSQGNACPCDFTMMALGNIRESSIADIWREIRRRFPVPGCVCYANKSSEAIAARKSDEWPLSPEESRRILQVCPSYDPDEIPEFYRRWGLDVKGLLAGAQSGESADGVKEEGTSEGRGEEESAPDDAGGKEAAW